jgi:hypothetical protein
MMYSGTGAKRQEQHNVTKNENNGLTDVI